MPGFHGPASVDRIRAGRACETRQMSTVLLAHQGGWDEALLILVPVGVFAALLSLANKRAKAVQRQREADANVGSGPGSTDHYDHYDHNDHNETVDSDTNDSEGSR